MSNESKTSIVQSRIEFTLKFIPILTALLVGAVYTFGLGYIDRLKIPVNPSIGETIGFFCTGALKVLASKFSLRDFCIFVCPAIFLSFPAQRLAKKYALWRGKVPKDYASSMLSYQERIFEISKEILEKKSQQPLDQQILKLESDLSKVREDLKNQTDVAVEIGALRFGLKVYVFLITFPQALYVSTISTSVASVVIPLFVAAFAFSIIPTMLKNHYVGKLYTPVLTLLIGIGFISSYMVPYKAGENSIAFDRSESLELFTEATPFKNELDVSRWLLWSGGETSYWMKCDRLQSFIEGVQNGKVIFTRDAARDMDQLFCRRNQQGRPG